MDPKTKKNTKSKTSTKKSTSVKTQTENYQSAVTTKKVTPKNKKIALAGLGIVFILLALGIYYKSLFIAATVNGQPITRLAVVKQLETQSGKQTLDALVTQTLILQEAKKKNIVITQKDVDAELTKISKNVEANGSTLDEALTAQGMTKNQLVEQIRIQLALDKLVGNNFTATDKEISTAVASSQAQLPEGSTVTADQLKTQAKAQIIQEKKQQAMQELISKLQKDAKINNYVSY